MGNCVFQIICNIFVSLLLLSLSVSGTTNGSEQDCFPQIKVPRNTVLKARVMTELKINCTVTVRGCHRSPRVSWCKIDRDYCNALNHSDYIKTEWKNTTEDEWIAFLIFLNISMEDAGSYRCVGHTSISYSIIVNVTYNKWDDVSHNQSNTSKGDLNTLQNDDQQWLWPYVYICCGIAGLVFIFISFIYVVRRRERKSARKDMANENQSSKTQKSDLLLPPHLYLNSDLLTSVIYTRV